MSDNIYKFPKRELDVDVTFEDIELHRDIVDATHTILQMNCEGIVATSDVDWEHIMDAALNVAINAGLRAGASVEELQDILATCTIEENNYDA